MDYVSFLVVGFLVLAGETGIAEEINSDMDEDELFGLFEVMESLVDDSSWGEVHPQPCTDTPWPGVQCEIGQDFPIYHVTKIHIGPDIMTPPCKTSANLSKCLLKLPYLKTLSIFNCFLTSPVTLSASLFGAFTSLEHLALSSNPSLSGEIPSSLSQVSTLKVLTLSQNNLKGKIPWEIGGLINLQQLDLSYNNFSGEIPEEIGGLKSLAIMDLSWNVLQGNVPYSLGKLELLQKIDLGFNRLGGNIPPSLGQLKRLELLDLSHNLLSGSIPETLSGLGQLEYFLVDQNPIKTAMPFFLGTLSKLTALSLSGCGLTGQIPNSLSSLKNLTSLSLDNNNLSGPIPPSLGSLPNLDQLNLSHNQLSGKLLLPEEFINRLGKRLDIRGNNGVCTSNQIYKKNISLYLETPVCLSRSKSWPEEEHPHENFKGMKPSVSNGKISSNGPLMNQKKLTFPSFLIYYIFLSFLL